MCQELEVVKGILERPRHRAMVGRRGQDEAIGATCRGEQPDHGGMLVHLGRWVEWQLKAVGRDDVCLCARFLGATQRHAQRHLAFRRAEQRATQPQHVDGLLCAFVHSRLPSSTTTGRLPKVYSALWLVTSSQSRREWLKSWAHEIPDVAGI